jgi:hypothetical protein
MSMNPEPDQFESLRRLLALKRHEQPPPGYFDRFSRQVIARIQAAEGTRIAPPVEGFGWQIPWLRRLWAALETQPIFAGAFGLAVCGLLAAGIVYSERTESMAVTIAPGPDLLNRPLQVADRPGNLLLERAFPASLSSTGGLSSGPLRDSLFREVQRPQVQLINATGRN